MNMEGLTFCYRFKRVGAAMKATVNGHLSPVVNVMNRWGFCSQVTGQSSDVLTFLLYLVWLLPGITLKSEVQCYQSLMLEAHEYDIVLL